MPLPRGTRLSSYEIDSLMGTGGMGEVYRAHDLKLKRTVAIKILPEAFADEPDRISRFEREAKVLASLNHANIAIIHDFREEAERHFLVMELVEGETLAERLNRRPVPIEEALQVARQIADALEAAHQKGIVHRDLKPANIKISPDGKVKVLDFGLAKIFESTTAAVDLSDPPTLIDETDAGVILGTASYMSPEQARGKPVDKRTDIWALGCVIYEMLAGGKAFGGENVSDTIAAVLRGEPDWNALPATTPRRIRRLLERCLRKDPRERLHDAADVRIEIDDVAADSTNSAPVAVPVHGHLSAFLFAIVMGVAIVGALAGAILMRMSSEVPSSVHLSFTLPFQTPSALNMNANHRLTISPDGKKVVYVVNQGEKRRLYLRWLGQAEGKLIDGPDDARNPFFSPDSEWIAFGEGNKLLKVAVSGGSPVTICTLSSTGFYGGDWGTDNTIVFVPDVNGGLWSVSANGGTPQSILRTDVDKDRVSYADPQVLPYGRGVLFTLTSGHAFSENDLDIAVLSPGARDPRVVIRGGSNARYLRPGQIVYMRDEALLSVGFDLSALAVTGTPVSVVNGIQKLWAGANYSISNNGTLMYEPDSGHKSGRIFAVVDLNGKVKAISSVPGNYDEFSVSPDGRSIAARVFGINDDIWVYDVATGAPLRLTFEPLDEIFPVWTPDGKRIAFGTRTGNIFWKSSDGTGQREELIHGDYPRFPTSFSPDGKVMAFVEVHPTRKRDIWLMPLDGNRDPQPLLATDADEWGAKFSPHRQWLAYVSDETGRNEIFIRPVSSSGGRKQVSSAGGTKPVWAPNGRELFFMKGDQLMASSVDAQGLASRDRVVLALPQFEDLRINPQNPNFDIMPDGEHFVFDYGRESSQTTHFNVVLNWFSELQQRVSVK
jgi:serine/threonine protein kinase